MRLFPSSLTVYFRRYRSEAIVGCIALVLVNGLEVILPLILRHVYDSLELASASTPTILLTCALGYVSVTSLQALCRVAWRLQLSRAGVSAASYARQRAATAAIQSFKEISVGEAVSLTQSDAENVGRSLDGGVIMVVDAFVLVTTIPIIMFFLNAKLAVLCLFPLPFITIFMVLLDKQIRERHSKSQAALSQMTDRITEVLTRIRSVRVSGAEQFFLNSVRSDSDKLRVASASFLRTEALFGPGLESFLSLALLSLVVFGTKDVLTGAVSLGTFLAFQKYLEQLQWPMRALALAATTHRKAAVSAERVAQFIKKAETISNIPDVSFGTPTSNVLTIRNLTVALAGTTLLDSLSLSISAREKVALIGTVGSGKSILLSVLSSLRNPSSGSIELCGYALQSYSEAKRTELVSLVPENVFLFGMSIRENLALGSVQHPASVSDEELWEVLKVVEIESEIRALPLQLDTILGERGVSLSGGQKQRLTLARAILRNPKLLLLDNSLSAVDGRTEQSIINNMKDLDCAILCATHRLSTVRRFDRIVVLDRKQIVKDLSISEAFKEPDGYLKEFIEQQTALQELDTFLSPSLHGVSHER